MNDRLAAWKGALPRVQDMREHVPPITARWLGRLGFAEALERQEEFVRQKRVDLTLPNELWLLEHDPVYTIGRTPDQSSLRGATHLPHPLFPINRGGQATYHGPGQLVGYFLIDLRGYGQDLHRYLRWIEALLIKLLALYELPRHDARRPHRCLGRKPQDRLDRRRRAPLDHHARLRPQRQRRPRAFRPDHTLRNRWTLP